MQGSIRKHVARDGTVTWRVRVDTVDPLSGRRRQPQCTFKTKREAEAGLRAWLVTIETGSDVERSTQTVARYLQSWLDGVQHRVKPATASSYRYLAEAYIVPALGAVPLQRLTPHQLQMAYARWLAPGGGRSVTGAPLSPRTVRYLHSILHTALKEALRLGLVARNVAGAVTPPRPVRREARAWSPEEARRFLDIARSDAYWPVWLLALHTGMRRGELLALRWRDLDLDGGVLRVRTGKTGGRLLDLDAPSVAALREHRARQLETRLLLARWWHDSDLVFPGERGRTLSGNTVGRHFRALAKAAGITPLPFHGLRHTHATILMLAGVHPKVVSERLGHRDIMITMDLYSHVLPQMHAQAAEAFARALRDGA